MILIDTSVWIDHLRRADPHLQRLLTLGMVLCHPFVIGELACGTLRRRTQVLRELAELPTVLSATHDEVLAMLERHSLSGRGVGWVDAHLLASAVITGGTRLWSHDTKLAGAATELGVGYLAV